MGRQAPDTRETSETETRGNEVRKGKRF